jgi:hypothetical protein
MRTHFNALVALAGMACWFGTGCPKRIEGPPLPQVPPALAVPAGQHLALSLAAEGEQIYTCSAKDSGAYEWSLSGPEAQLFDASHAQVGKHYLGPTWELNDGSKVVGAVKQKVDAPEPDAVPWLLLEAKSASGPGLLEAVTFVQRLATHGGKAPATGCDAQHVGQQSRTPYQATYAFFVKD